MNRPQPRLSAPALEKLRIDLQKACDEKDETRIHQLSWQLDELQCALWREETNVPPRIC